MIQPPHSVGTKRLLYFIAFVAATTLLWLTFLYYMGSNKYDTLKKNMIITAEEHLRGKKELLGTELLATNRDLEYVSGLFASLFSRGASTAAPIGPEYFSEFFASLPMGAGLSGEAHRHLKRFSKSHPDYLQIRLIDPEGMETVRIDNLRGEAVVVASDALQHKRNRYYLEEAEGLGPDEVYLSALDLNIENQKVEMPYQPVLRFVTPVFGTDHKKRGYAVLNYSGSKLLSRLTMKTTDTETLLLNKASYYLIGFAPEEEWGFMLGRKEATFKARFPASWEEIAGHSEGHLETEDYLFVFSHFYPEQYLNGGATRFGRDWVIIHYMEKQTLIAHVGRYLDALLVIILPYYLLTLIIAWFIATYIVQLQQAKLRIKIAHQAFENAYEGIMVTTPGADIVQVNKGFSLITGHAEHDVIGRNVRILHAQNAQAAVSYRQLWQALKTQGRWSGELWNVHKDGTLYLASLTVSAILDNRGTPLYYITVFTDITRHRKLAEQLQEQIEANKAQHRKMLQQSRMAQMGQMIGMIAHQWRQPLASVSTIAGNLTIRNLMDEYDKDFFHEQLEAIGDLSDHLSATINDFRNFSREDRTKTEVSIDETVRQGIRIVAPTLEADGIRIHRSGSDVRVTTYPNELRQVVLNILKNAEDALKEGQTAEPQIWIRHGEEEGMAYLTFEDNAGGIPAGHFEKIFDSDFSTKMQRDGTGLGLYMSKTIIEEHCGGSLTATNTERGACFTIRLPNGKSA
jgi:PAS domain S-box-containing protein